MLLAALVQGVVNVVAQSAALLGDESAAVIATRPKTREPNTPQRSATLLPNVQLIGINSQNVFVATTSVWSRSHQINKFLEYDVCSHTGIITYLGP